MSRNKIWVIDDDRAMRWVLEKTFKEEGFDVTNFEEAQTALERLHHDAPDVILTDIRMPGIDGLTFLSKVKNTPRLTCHYYDSSFRLRVSCIKLSNWCV